MFTGIIEEIGEVKKIEKNAHSMKLAIAANKVLEDAALGDSISVNGVCLTVTKYTSNEFEVDIMPETFYHTSLNDLQTQSKVNLERALAANGRLGGHFVSGHADCTGEIIQKRAVENAIYITIKIESNWMKYMMEKGSVAIDGTSLTVFSVGENDITISLIPHTQKETVINQKRLGQRVNIECDLLAKYMERLLTATEKEKGKKPITLDLLGEAGFL
ncbi:riboflavin synthase [Falsibacillus albus]|uniref:Riboflavin synthase n=1 Tax=Falsibacillus albus TaxID=2478915 RepID=A0A3L7JYP5_9BACI|nr:riboflavin synthase [Falsibacillus albus]RLQ95229.1 riboflavin synthase [Falsibacillus albus]